MKTNHIFILPFVVMALFTIACAIMLNDGRQQMEAWHRRQGELIESDMRIVANDEMVQRSFKRMADEASASRAVAQEAIAQRDLVIDAFAKLRDAKHKKDCDKGHEQIGASKYGGILNPVPPGDTFAAPPQIGGDCGPNEKVECICEGCSL